MNAAGTAATATVAPARDGCGRARDQEKQVTGRWCRGTRVVDRASRVFDRVFCEAGRVRDASGRRDHVVALTSDDM